MFEFIIKNKEWIFSGIGVFLIGGFISALCLLFRKRQQTKKKSVSYANEILKDQQKVSKAKIPQILPEAQENILKFLATLSSNERLEADEIAGYLRWSPQKTQLILDQLVEKNLIAKPGDSYVSDLFPKKYRLDDGGRIYLHNRGLL